MSNFIQPTKHPLTRKIEPAVWLDNYFGNHKYGIEFPNGEIFRERDLPKFSKTFSENSENKEDPPLRAVRKHSVHDNNRL